MEAGQYVQGQWTTDIHYDAVSASCTDPNCNEDREAKMVVLARGADDTPSIWCDPCIAPIIKALNDGGVETIASCCGHRERDGSILLKDGRELVIRQFDPDRRDIVLRKLTEPEKAIRLAHIILDRPNTDPDDDLALLARQLLRLHEKDRALPMSIAPRDGTHILAYLYNEPDDCGYQGFGEWREVYYKEITGLMGMRLCWHAGDPDDGHTGNEAPEHYGEGVPIAWLPLPRQPQPAEAAT